jgi:hypothetical protein
MSEEAPFAGRWMLIADTLEIRTAVFTAEGALTYFITLGARELVMPLRYRIEGATIVTLAEGATEEVRAGFLFADHDTLVLDYDGEKFTYRRVLA